MSDRAAIVTGASRGIGLALAETLGDEGFGLTITARRPENIEQAAHDLQAKGFEVEHLAANMADEEAIREVVRRHRDRYGRLDVLVNNAGVGVGAQATPHQTKYVDMQLGVNLPAIILFYPMRHILATVTLDRPRRAHPRRARVQNDCQHH